MAELIIELFSEEIPAKLQIDARQKIKQIINERLEKKLPLPAYDQCLKASHVFNLLDARGVIGVAQRTEYISRIRELAKGSGEIWLETQKNNG